MTNYPVSKSTPRPKKKRRIVIFIVLFLLVGLALIIDSNTRIVTTEYTVESPEIPSGFDGYRIVQLSDLHGTVFGENNENLFAAVKEARPDMIAVTGDFIDDESAEQFQYAEDVIEELSAIAPVYYVTGNHEWGSGTARDVFAIIDGIENAHYLRNRFTMLEKDGDELLLAGMDDPNGLRDQKTLPEVRENIRSSGYEGFILMLAHRNSIEIYDGQDIDLVLTGHGHGGIVRLPFTDGLISSDFELLPDNMSGLCKTSDGGYMLVSRGLGNNPYTLRLFNNPEIAVVELKSK